MIRTQHSSYVNCSALVEKELKTVPFNPPIHTQDVTAIVAREKARISGPLCRTASSLFSSRPEFSPGNFSDPRPPEEADMIAEMTQSQLLDTSVHDNDPAILMQLFLSDLTPEEELSKLGGCGLGVATTTTTPPTSLEVDRERQSVISTVSSPTSSLVATVPQLPSPTNPLTDSGISSEAPSRTPTPVPTPMHTSQPHDHGNNATTTCDDIITVLMSSASPLECTDSNGFSDPLDNPFLTESTDLSDFLQDPSVSAMLSSSNTHTPSPPTPSTNTTTVCNSDSDTTPFPLNLMSEFGLSQSPSNTDVHVNVLDTCTHNSDLNLFDLSQNASLLPSSFDVTEVENLDIDFSTFCSDTLSLLPTTTCNSENDSITSEQLSVMLTQAQQQQQQATTTSTSSSMVDLGPPSVSNSSSCDDVFMESSPSPSTLSASDQLSVTELTVSDKTPKATKSRKRQASDLDSDAGDGGDGAPVTKKTKLSSRRQKNNIASQVSRAKRKAKNTAMFDRVGELESENAMLRIKEKELTDEIERLKNILVHRLSK